MTNSVLRIAPAHYRKFLFAQLFVSLFPGLLMICAAFGNARKLSTGEKTLSPKEVKSRIDALHKILLIVESPSKNQDKDAIINAMQSKLPIKVRVTYDCIQKMLSTDWVSFLKESKAQKSKTNVEETGRSPQNIRLILSILLIKYGNYSYQSEVLYIPVIAATLLHAALLNIVCFIALWKVLKRYNININLPASINNSIVSSAIILCPFAFFPVVLIAAVVIAKIQKAAQKRTSDEDYIPKVIATINKEEHDFSITDNEQNNIITAAKGVADPTGYTGIMICEILLYMAIAISNPVSLLISIVHSFLVFPLILAIRNLRQQTPSGQEKPTCAPPTNIITITGSVVVVKDDTPLYSELSVESSL